MKTIGLMFCGAMAIYALLMSILFTVQRHLIYFPAVSVPHPFEQDVLSSGADILSAIMVNPGQSHGIFYFGGNAESVSITATELADQLDDKTLYLIEYRGYGRSSGTPSENAFYQDALAWYDKFSKQHKQISVIGRSIGSGVATYLAASQPVDRMVLITPFDSIVHVAQKQFKWVPVSWLLTERFESIQRAPSISVPTLIMIAQNDKIIPPQHAMALASAFSQIEPRVITIKSADHNTINLAPEYYPIMRKFLDK